MRYCKAWVLSAVLTLFVLTGCGGNNSAGDSGATAQSKHLTRSQKTTATDYATVVQQLYIAYFGRPADPAGLSNFENELLSLNAPTDVTDLAEAYKTNPAISQLIDSFGLSPESQALYGSGTTDDFVNAVFKNVLGRTPATAGLSFWAAPIDAGTLSKGNAALAIMAGAFASSTANSAQGIIDVQLIDNRVNVASYFTGQVSSQNAVGDYAGSVAAGTARNFLNTVTSSADASTFYSAAVTAITSLISGAALNDVGNYCGNVSGAFSGSVNLTFVSAGSSQYNITGSVNIPALGGAIPIVGTAQPPALNVVLQCQFGQCGTVSGTITSSTITGSYSTPDGSGQVSLSRTCN